MDSSWGNRLLLRVGALVGACVLIVGSAWLFSGNLGQKGVAQDQGTSERRAPEPSKEEPAPKTIPNTTVEPSKVVKETKPIVEPSKPPSDGKAPKIIEVDLSKLPPDLAKQVQGAIIQGPKK